MAEKTATTTMNNGAAIVFNLIADSETSWVTSKRDKMIIFISGDFGGTGTATVEYNVKDLAADVGFPDEALEFDADGFCVINCHSQLAVRVVLDGATSPDLDVVFLV